jgi:Protein of unknown function (DUF3307)
LPIVLIWLHFIADFIFQTDKMAINKSSSNRWLGLHVACYTAPFFWFGWCFALVNGAAHFVTDWLTSRGTSYLWKKEERHWFFALIGLDQAIHTTTLFATYRWLV